MKKIGKAMVSAMVVVAGIVWLSTSVEAAPRSSANSSRYCLLDNTYKVVQKECRLLKDTVLEQTNATKAELQTSDQTNDVNGNTENEVPIEAAANEAVPMNVTTEELVVAETVPAANVTPYCPQPQDGTGYHHGSGQQGNGRHDGSGQSRGNGLQDGSGAGRQQGRNAGNCLR